MQLEDSIGQARQQTPSPPPQDRRGTDRLLYSARIAVTWAEGTFQGYSADLSETGVFVETTNLLALETSVVVEFKVSGADGRQSVRAAGRVVRHVTIHEAADRGLPPGLAIGFEQVVEGAATLSRFISERLRVLRAPRPAVVAPEPTHPRTLVALPVSWGTDPGLGGEGYLQTLGASGAFVETRTPEPVGTHLYLWYELPVAGATHSVRATAVVVDVHPPGGQDAPGMGIAFETSTPEASRVERFVDTRLRHEATFASAPSVARQILPEGRRLEVLLLASTLMGLVVSLVAFLFAAYT